MNIKSKLFCIVQIATLSKKYTSPSILRHCEASVKTLPVFKSLKNTMFSAQNTEYRTRVESTEYRVQKVHSTESKVQCLEYRVQRIAYLVTSLLKMSHL